jgi:hypothetical protein
LFLDLYFQAGIDVRRLVNSCIPETIDFYLETLHYDSEFSVVKIRLTEIKRMVHFDSLNDAIQSHLELMPLIDIYFSECGLNLNRIPDPMLSSRQMSERYSVPCYIH